MTDIDTLKMVPVYCPVCRGSGIDCSDMKRCPLALAKFKGVIISPEEFARQNGTTYIPQAVEVELPPCDTEGQFSLF